MAPISSDVALIIGLLAKYNTDKDKTPGMGTVFAGCMPYAIATFIAELILLGIVLMEEGDEMPPHPMIRQEQQAEEKK